MPITIFWDDEQQTTIQMEFQGNWTVEDFINATADIRDLVDGREHGVDLIINVRHAGFPPSNFIAHFKQAADAARVNHMILAGGGQLGKIMVQSVQKVYRTEGFMKLRTTRNVDEARQLLAELRSGGD